MTATQQPSTKQDILNFLLKKGEASAQDLAEHLAISPQAVRRHLKDLEEENLIEHRAVQSGMGRPNYFYVLSRTGRDRFPDRYDEFAVALLNTLAETVTPEQMGTILRKQWEQKALFYRDRIGAGSLQERVANLVELRNAEGYMAEWYAVDLSQNPEAQVAQAQTNGSQAIGANGSELNGSELNGSVSNSSISNGLMANSAGSNGSASNSVALQQPNPGAESGAVNPVHGFGLATSSNGNGAGASDPNSHFIITEYNCAIAQIAESFPGVCGHELEMFEMALEGCQVERTHWMVSGEHRCGYLIQPK